MILNLHIDISHLQEDIRFATCSESCYSRCHILVPSLQKAGFKVTCISRSGSTSLALPITDIRSAKYDDIASLESSFNGQDAISEAFNPSAAVAQRVIGQVAFGDHIVHPITLDFPGDMFNPYMSELMRFETRIKAPRELKMKGANSDPALSSTAIIIGPWFDWATEAGAFWIDKKDRKITWFDSGAQ
ncbi:hypothetical protein S40293_10185 [Stachybotrys chartarum IBT 40293]|nr:hypothetical protein S40293_10185 [Stachybotrys chartarum IBT 40293]